MRRGLRRAHGGRHGVRGLKHVPETAERETMKPIAIVAPLLAAVAALIARPAAANSLAETSAATGINSTLSGNSAGSAHSVRDSVVKKLAGSGSGGAAHSGGGKSAWASGGSNGKNGGWLSGGDWDSSHGKSKH